MAPGLVGGDSRYRAPLATGDSGEEAAGFLAAAPGPSSTRESMISCRSFSMELTRELWLAQAEGPGGAGCGAWFPFTRLSDSAQGRRKDASGPGL